ncbi:MAG: helix-turn-helix transcriptional regulator [Raoultibacter sp.]
MRTTSFLHILTPNVTSLGYALFLAINAAGIWGGVFPFLPMDFQTPQIIFQFFLAQSLVFAVSYFVSTGGVYFIPGPTRRFLVLTAAIPYFLGWCFLIGAIYVDHLAAPLVTIGGGFLGLGSAGFFMLWQRLFASQDAKTGNHDLILGTAISALLYFSLYLIPRAVTVFLIPLVFLPLFGLCIVLKSRTIDLSQPMFEDVPRKHPNVYKKAIKNYWRSAFSIGTLGFCCGVVRALAIGDPLVGSLVNIASMIGSLVAALGLLLVWQNKSLHINVTSAYRFFFPLLITAFALLPFAGPAFSSIYAGLLYAVYSIAIMLMMIQCAQASRDSGINPVFIYGFFGGTVYLLHDIGFVGGSFAEQVNVLGITPLAAVALLSLYLLGIMYFIGQGGFRQALSGGQVAAERIEFVSLNAPDENETHRLIEQVHDLSSCDERREGLPDRPGTPQQTSPQTKPVQTVEQAAEQNARKNERFLKDIDTPQRGRSERFLREGDAPQYRDRISKQCALMQQHYRLSAREAEVMELIVRGNSVVRIAEDLVVSENTIRTHSKRIYTKLAVHKKQELIDLVEAFDPRTLPRT